MTGMDLLVIVIYCIMLLGVGGVFSRNMKNSSDMFAAGRQSPWWISGISAYMTMFSAGTFVVWGGIAYDFGFVAISISLCYGVGAFFAGLFFASRWRKLGLNTAAEFIQLRFGRGAFHFYTWWKIIVRTLTTGLMLYGLAVMLCPLIEVPMGSFLADTEGHLSIEWACILLGGVVIFYTMCGGLWAVLMTDTLQFFVLMLAVVIVIPLSLDRIGGLNELIARAPEGFLRPTAGKFTWFFLVGWMLAHMFMLGGEWMFVQRYFCVPKPRDAKKACYLFCALYLTTPFLWMLPPMIYRILKPGGDPQEAYILMCKEVLPAGMVGLMMAAMFSATASAISSMLNVNASVVTDDVYRKILRPQASDREVVLAGRILTVVLGIWLVLGGVLLPRLASYRNFVLVFASLLGSSLLLPTIWGLFSTKIRQSSVWSTVIASVITGSILKFGLKSDGFLGGIESLSGLIAFVEAHSRVADLFVGIMTPLVVLVIMELRGKADCSGWQRLQETVKQRQAEEKETVSSSMPAKVICWNLGFLAVLMAFLAIFGSEKKSVLWTTAVILAVMTILFYLPGYLEKRRASATTGNQP